MLAFFGIQLYILAAEGTFLRLAAWHDFVLAHLVSPVEPFVFALHGGSFSMPNALPISGRLKAGPLHWLVRPTVAAIHGRYTESIFPFTAVIAKTRDSPVPPAPLL